MGQFDYRVQRRVEPKVLLQAVAQRVEGEHGWRVDSKTDRFILASRDTPASPLRSLLRLFSTDIVFREGRVSTRPESDRYSADILVTGPKPEGHEFLSAQSHPDRGGAELELRGDGGKAKRLARRLLRDLEALSDADLRRASPR